MRFQNSTHIGTCYLLLNSTGNGAEEFEKLISFDKSISFTTSGNGAMEL